MSFTKILTFLCAIALSEAAVTVLRNSHDSNSKHPSSMEIEVNLPNSHEKAKLTLKRIESNRNAKISMADGGVITSFPQHLLANANGHYEDLENGALISSRFVNGKQQFAGHFSHKGEAYFLESPNLKSSEHEVRSAPQSLAKDSAEDFIDKALISDVKAKLGLNTDSKFDAAFENSLDEMVAEKKLVGPKGMTSNHHRNKRQATTTYTVEVYVLLDHTIWNFFRSQSSSDTEALTFLDYYYQHIMKSVDRVYRNIGSLSISVETIGYYIAKTATDAGWMKSNDGEVILSNLNAYAASKNIVADHVMAFTRTDIHGSGSFSVCGMAYVSATCKASKTSINEDGGLHSWGTAAHELAHNLGSRHDGSGNTCDPNLYNIMSPSSGFYNINSIGNSYRLSSCSISYITSYVQSLSAKCLTINDAAGLPVNNDQAGKRWSLDQVCKFALPDSTGFYATSAVRSSPASMCFQISCKKGTGYTTQGGMRAPVGTHCGDRKSCSSDGKCVYDSSAPAANEKCFFGNVQSDANCVQYTGWVQQSASWASANCAYIKAYCCKTIGTHCDAYA